MPNGPRQSILCPNCNKLISSDELTCPHCGISRPGSPWKNIPITRSLFGGDQIIRTVIYANVGMYLISLLLNPTSLGLSPDPFRFLSPSTRSLLLLGSTGGIPIDQLHRWWTLISANYLHGGLLHIMFNMLAFRQIGTLVIREYGLHRFVILYTIGGITGFFVSYLAGVRLTIGASAAVCSLIGASLYYGKSRGGTYGQAIYKQLSGWVLGLFLFGFLVPGIDNWGHGGGIAAGIILGFSLSYQDRRKENHLHKFLAALCIGSTIAVLTWAILSSFYFRFLG